MCREVRDWLNTQDQPIVIGDGGDIVATAAKILPVRGEGAWMDPGPLGTLGVGMPFAIAAKLAHPDRPVVIMYGDGSFGFNGFEYDTAVRFGLPIIGIVGNDGAWGQMMRPQLGIYGEDRLAAVLLNRTRYDKVVEGARRSRRARDGARSAASRARTGCREWAPLADQRRDPAGPAITRAVSTSSGLSAGGLAGGVPAR